VWSRCGGAHQVINPGIDRIHGFAHIAGDPVEQQFVGLFMANGISKERHFRPALVRNALNFRSIRGGSSFHATADAGTLIKVARELSVDGKFYDHISFDLGGIAVNQVWAVAPLGDSFSRC